MNINLAYLENNFMTPGYPKERDSWQWSIRTFEKHIRDGLLQAPRVSRYNHFEYELVERQKTEILLGVLFMVGLPAVIEGENFDKYASVLWQVVYAVPVTAFAGDQIEKYRFWTNRQKVFLAEQRNWYGYWKNHQGGW